MILIFCSHLPTFAFDHAFSEYDSVLTNYVAHGQVDYAALRTNRNHLDKFLDDCATVKFEEYDSFLPEEKLAFLINLYNAAALRLICDHPDTKSIQEFKGLFSDVWQLKCVELFDHTASLGQILHDILRPEFKDTRIHFALVTGCKSDPELMNHPYRAQILREQFERQMDKFMLERPDANRFENGTLYLSPKFKWYAVDFGKRADLLQFAARYYPEVIADTPIQFTPFDWSLNSQ